MKQRYLTEGFENFAPHEVLEMLLFYAKPQGDVNPTAHALLDRFGSLHAIFESPVSDIAAVPGMGEHSAILLKLIPELLRRYVAEQRQEVECFDTLSKVGDYLYHKFIGLDYECLYMMMFDNRMGLIDCVRVAEGNVSASNVPFRLMTEKILQRRASAIVLAHNHPSGLPIPSSEDLNVTDELDNLFSVLDITVVEHLIVTERNFYPIMRHRTSEFRASPIRTKGGEGFFQRFYDLPDADYYDYPPIFD